MLGSMLCRGWCGGFFRSEFQAAIKESRRQLFGGFKMKTKTSKSSSLSLVWLAALALSLCSAVKASGQESDDNGHLRSTAEDFLRVERRPIANVHHGDGPKPGENPAPPFVQTVVSRRPACRVVAPER